MPLAGRFRTDFPHLDCDRLFALAADIESYPGFIPWCRRARILERDGCCWLVENHFGAGPVDVRFHTTARPRPPEELEITASDGPFRSFRLLWRFLPLPGGGCRVEAGYRMSLRSPLLQGLAMLSMHEVERRVIRNFHDRARSVYGERAAL
jgi:coenzyme Q-binding protein COQ10